MNLDTMNLDTHDTLSISNTEDENLVREEIKAILAFLDQESYDLLSKDRRVYNLFSQKAREINNFTDFDQSFVNFWSEFRTYTGGCCRMDNFLADIKVLEDLLSTFRHLEGEKKNEAFLTYARQRSQERSLDLILAEKIEENIRHEYFGDFEYTKQVKVKIARWNGILNVGVTLYDLDSKCQRSDWRKLEMIRGSVMLDLKKSTGIDRDRIKAILYSGAFEGEVYPREKIIDDGTSRSDEDNELAGWPGVLFGQSPEKRRPKNKCSVM